MDGGNGGGSDVGAKGVRKVAPLFRSPVDAAGTRYLYADEISDVDIMRIVEQGRSRSKRESISEEEYQRQDGSYFEVDPFVTKESDIFDHFGAGEFYINPIGLDGKFLPGGRTISQSDAGELPYGGGMGGGMGGGGRGPYNQQQQSGGWVQTAQGWLWPANQGPPPAGGPPGSPGYAAPTFVPQQPQQPDLTTSLITKLVDGKQDTASAELIASLREQLIDAKRAHGEELSRLTRVMEDDRRKSSNDLDEERRRFRKLSDDEREDYTTKRRAMETELQRARDDLHNERDANRKVFDRDLEDERRKRITEVDDTRKRLDARVTELERILFESRAKYEAQVDALKKENYDLRSDVADMSKNLQVDGVASKDDPTWFKAVEKFGAPVAKAAFDWASKQAQAAQQGQAQQQQQQAQAGQRPAQQVASPVQQPVAPQQQYPQQPVYPAQQPVQAARQPVPVQQVPRPPVPPPASPPPQAAAPQPPLSQAVASVPTGPVPTVSAPAVPPVFEKELADPVGRGSGGVIYQPEVVSSVSEFGSLGPSIMLSTTEPDDDDIAAVAAEAPTANQEPPPPPPLAPPSQVAGGEFGASAPTEEQSGTGW